MSLLAQKVVIVTGIGPGFGRVLAEEAATLGAKVAMVSRSPELMGEVAEKIASNGGEAITVQADVTDLANCQRAADATLEAFGRIDGLVNSAYFPGDIKPVNELDLDALAQAFNVTVLGTLRTRGGTPRRRPPSRH